MYCVAEGIENGRQLVGNIVVDLEGVESRDRQVFGKRARPVNADARCIAAQVPTARPAIPAIAASDMPFARNAVANSEAADLLPYFHDFTHVLMPHMHGHRDRFGGPIVPVPDMHIDRKSTRLNSSH